MNSIKQTLVRVTGAIFFLSLIGFLPGSGIITAGSAVAEEAVNIDEMLNQSPEKMPDNYTDE